MTTPDIDYLRRIAARTGPAELLREPAFLRAQDLFFAVVKDLGGAVDFDLADMREVHAVAALGDVQGLTVLDVGCGSTEPYVLEDTFRDRYPPFFAEMMQARGARVTGTDIRPNPTARYDHRVLDSTEKGWAKTLSRSYDIVAALSLFNAPGSPFEHNPALCDRLMDDCRTLLNTDGLLIVTLRDDLFTDGSPVRAGEYAASKGFRVLHLDGNCASLAHA